MESDNNLKFIVYNGIFTLLGVLIGTTTAIIKDLIFNKATLKLEITKAFNKNRIEVYKQLLQFTKDLQTITKPDNEDVYIDFLQYFKENKTIIPLLPYFPKNIIDDIIKIEQLYEITRVDLNYIIPPRRSIEVELPKLVEKLYRDIIKVYKNWNS